MKLWKATNENFWLSIMKPFPTLATLQQGAGSRQLVWERDKGRGSERKTGSSRCK